MRAALVGRETAERIAKRGERDEDVIELPGDGDDAGDQVDGRHEVTGGGEDRGAARARDPPIASDPPREPRVRREMSEERPEAFSREWIGRHRPEYAADHRGPITPYRRVMPIRRIDNIGIVVEDLAAAIAFFVELGMELEGQTTVEGSSVDRLIGLDGVRSDIAMLRTPDGQARLELSKFRTPKARRSDPHAPVNTLGMGRIMFTVEDMDEVVARLRSRGAELVGEVVQYGDSYRLCYVRGPEGIVIALAEELRTQN